MKTLFLTCALYASGLFVVNVKCQQVQARTNIKEDFMQFLEKFSLDRKFQLERIQFPLMHVGLDESLTKLKTSYIKKENWEVRFFCFEPNKQSYSQVYDNFEHVLRDTNERVFAWHGIGNGIKQFLYFKRIDGRWYLIKEEDLST